MSDIVTDLRKRVDTLLDTIRFHSSDPIELLPLFDAFIDTTDRTITLECVLPDPLTKSPRATVVYTWDQFQQKTEWELIKDSRALVEDVLKRAGFYLNGGDE